MGNIAVIGGHLLSPELIRFTDLVFEDYIVNSNKPGAVKALFISQKEIKQDGKLYRAMFDSLTESIVISVREIFDTAVDFTCRTTKSQLLSVQAMCHMWFMEALCHEVFHAKSFANSKYGWDHHAEEPDAEDFAISAMYDVVRKHDYVLPAIENDGWFGNEILDWYDIVKDTDEEPLRHFVSLHKDKAVFRNIKTGSGIYNLREFFRISDKNPTDPAWSTVVVQPAPLAVEIPTAPAVETPVAPTTSYDEDEDEKDYVVHTSYDVVDTENWVPPMGEEPFEDGTPVIPKKEVKVPEQPRDPQPHTMMKPPMSVSAQSEVAKAIFGRLFTHMFEKCGWNHETGKWDAGSVGAVFQPIPIDDIQGSKDVVLKMNATIGGSYKRAADVDKYIIGDLTRAGVPKYELFMNANGNFVKRVLVPASISATGTTAAKEMLSGVRVAWLLDGHVKEGEDSIVLKMSSSGGNINFESWRKK